MHKCESCRYWDRDTALPPKYGHCEGIRNREDLDGSEAEAQLALMWASYDGYAFLRTHADFACAMHEAALSAADPTT